MISKNKQHLFEILRVAFFLLHGTYTMKHKGSQCCMSCTALIKSVRYNGVSGASNDTNGDRLLSIIREN